MTKSEVNNLADENKFKLLREAFIDLYILILSSGIEIRMSL